MAMLAAFTTGAGQEFLLTVTFLDRGAFDRILMSRGDKLSQNTKRRKCKLPWCRYGEPIAGRKEREMERKVARINVR